MQYECGPWVDRRALDNCGELLGVIVDEYADATTGQVTWLGLATGFFGTRIAVVPVRGASLLGDDVVIAHDRNTILTAPHVDVVIEIDRNQQWLLIDHYARPHPAAEAANPERGT